MASQSHADAGWQVLLRREYIPALTALLGGVLLHSMNVLLLATVLPSIVDELGGATLMSWPTTAFLASSIVAATCTGLLTALIGARNTFCAGALIFGTGALLCAVAPSMGLVAAGRFVQGFGGGLLSAVAYVLVRTTFPEAAWSRAIALMAAMWSVSILLGPLAGGLFARLGDWRSAFFFVSALSGLLLVLAWRSLPPTPASPRTATPAVPGGRVALICAAIAALSSAAVIAGPLAKSALIVLAVAILVAALRLDRVARMPLLPSDALSLRTQTGLGLWLVLLLSITYSPLQIYLSIFLQKLHGLDPLESGYAVACASLGWTAAAILVAGATPHWTNRLLVMGPALMGAGLLAIAFLTPGESVAPLLPAIVAIGVGIGGCWAFVVQRVMSGGRAGEEAVTASSIATVQQMGYALGAALSGLVANASGLAGGLDRAGVANAAFWTPAWFVVAAIVATATALRLTSRRPPGHIASL